MPSEFEIIRQYFFDTTSRDDVVLGIGDDAAVLEVPQNQQLVQSMDTLVSGIHFPVDTSAADIAYKALAVNLSDMAAMGAEPAWFTLAITLPGADEQWIKDFSLSLLAIAKKYKVQLIGGDTTTGPLSITITINGFLPKGQALCRSSAKVNDRIYVSGTLGDAALALAAWQGQCLISNTSSAYLNQRLNRPNPQVELGLVLRDYANACIDISDGLVADLGHITDKSKVGATIYCEKIPSSAEFKQNLTDETLAYSLILSGGDDYELCFTVAEKNQAEFETVAKKMNFSVSCIGIIESKTGIRCLNKDEEFIVLDAGYQHF